MEKIKRIGIVGPESTGKSQLAIELSAHYGCGYVKETAREYLEQLPRPYEEYDLSVIARLQVAEEERVLATNPPLLLCDTTLMVIRIWSQYKYHRVHPEIVELDESRHYDLFLLTDIDLPWEDDPLREHPKERTQLFSLYYRTLIRQSTPFHVIFGKGKERFQSAIRVLA